ncbi:MAG: hypothetical protein HY226_03215 [Candidatus Vogelbacteria bacterium]|nr:hypothetical protein [Candidatus Vogelbacteria bacterium]
MGIIEEFMNGKITPMTEKGKDGKIVSDLSSDQVSVANARLEADKTEAARILLEKVANEKSSQGDRQKEINNILKDLNK